MPETLIFDLDDTLIPTVQYYKDAQRQLAEYLQDVTGTEDSVQTIMDEQEAIDQQMYEQIGVTEDRFKEACMYTTGRYVEKTGTDPSDIDYTKIEDIGMYPIEDFSADSFLPGAEQALQFANEQDVQTVLLTKGIPSMQEPKIEAMGLEDYMDAINIVSEKQDYFEDLDGDGHWMIGNSLSSDIEPALAENIGAIHVEEGQTWAADEIEDPLDTEDPWMRLGSLDQFPAAYEAAQQYEQTGTVDPLADLRLDQ